MKHDFTSDTPLIIGVDEVGRGSLFGQMTVAAVILPADISGEFDKINLTNTALSPLNDSKKLSPKKRDLLFDVISQISLSHVIVDVPASVIDAINIYQATLLGMRLAIERLLAAHTTTQTAPQILIDGNATPILSANFYAHQPHIRTIIKGDGVHSSIAAASILAKVHRDRSMIEFAKQYPKYHLDKHKGYASAAHTHAIKTLGILPEHRKTFSPMKDMLAQGELFS
ncbi:ribonuclease HII [Moraxella caviae]|uniref:Ribonuclease HII n=1 Tax=Moraxella caviae TaxID=34060 RepID=A0A1T0A6K9_9GAMM|nr:ribonuclease HII [Moraxella caviae]